MKFWDIHRKYINSDLFYTPPQRDYVCLCYRNVVNSTDNSTVLEQISRVNCSDNGGMWMGSSCDGGNDDEPEVFYFSIVFMLGTFMVAWYLRKFYYTPFLTSLVSHHSILII